MISLGGQISVQLNIGGIDDFVDVEDFHAMRIAEVAGGTRPILNLDFQVNDSAVCEFLNTGNIITLMFGIDEPVSEIMQFEIVGDTKNKDYHVGSSVSLLGAMYRPSFTSTVCSDSFINKKSYEALNEIAARNNMNLITNKAISTNDKQTWYQNGMTDWEMIDYIVSRAYLNTNTFFSYGFDCNNIYFYDVRESLKEGVKWILSVDGGAKEDINSPIVNISTYSCNEGDVGMLSDLAGKNVKTIGYNVDTGEMLTSHYQLKTFTTMDTNKINVNPVGCKNYSYMITTGDEHPFLLDAINQNRRNNALFSSYVCHVPVAGQFRNFRLLDTVQLIPLETDKEAEGFYFITGISREYVNNVYTTVLTLNREGANGMDGNLAEGE